ncbi:MAG: MgtC/SapB family protein [Candidatus Omnitrophica bacterium]|nr:MgtC/SapB family protein [Candidatus Omnitrophota bacterium]
MISHTEVIVRLLLVTLLTGIIGFEREIHGRLAGLRTHILVGLGACLVMMTSMYMYEAFRGLTNLDPGRIAAQVVSGIGFLGAGTIIRSRASVKGLTTAASLWTSSGVGLAVGAGFYIPAVYATVLIWISLFILPYMEHSIRERVWYKVLHVEIRGGLAQLEQVKKALLGQAVEIRDIEFPFSEDVNMTAVDIHLKLLRKELESQIITAMLQIDGVIVARWTD